MKGKFIAITTLAILMLTPTAWAGDSAQATVDQAQRDASAAAASAQGTADAAVATVVETAQRELLPGAPAIPVPDQGQEPEDPSSAAPDEGPGVPDVEPDTSWALAFLMDQGSSAKGLTDAQQQGASGILAGAAEFGTFVVLGTYSALAGAADGLTTYGETTVNGLLQSVEDLSSSLVGEGTCTSGCDEDASVLAVNAVASEVVGPTNQVTAVALVAVGGLGLLAGVLALARKGIGLGGVALLSRIQSKDIMKNETRANVYEIVKSDPGVALNEIVDRLGVSRNAVAYHLAVFESESQVVSVKDGKYRRYFINGGKFVNGAKDVVSALKNDTTRHVVEYIHKHPGVIQKDVCAALGTSPSATNWHISRLEKVGLVTKNKVANTVQYSPGPSFEKYDLAEFGLRAGA